MIESVKNYQDKIESRINSSNNLLYTRGMKNIEESLQDNLKREYPNYHLQVSLPENTKEGQTLLDIKNELQKLGYIVFSHFNPVYNYTFGTSDPVLIDIIVPMKDESEEHCKQRIKAMVMLHQYSEDELHNDIYPKGTSKMVLDVIRGIYKGE